MHRTILAVLAILAAASIAHAQPLRGTVQSGSFTGPVTGRTVLFNIYLPEHYATSAERYPVIYHLHGLGGSQGGTQTTIVPRSFETAQSLGVIGPVIVVFPNGYTDAWWADSFDAAKPAETDVLKQLIPYVDGNFRTIPTPGARAIQGFSMGGFGATKFYTKFPELFAAAIEYDGALLTWDEMRAFQPGSAAAIFGGSESYFDQYSPWYWSAQHAATLRPRDDYRMVVGLLLAGNRRFRDSMVSLSIPVDYVETGCGHDLGCMLNAQGLNSASFIAARLDLTPPACFADCDASGALDIRDFTCFQNAFAVGDKTRADCTADGVLDIRDFTCFQNRFGMGCP